MNMFSRKNRKGFTLIELIIVIAILAILAAIAVPSFIGITDNANETVEIANARALVTSINAYNALNPTNMIAATSEVTAERLGTLYPSNLSAVDAAAAIARITITNNEAALSAPSAT